MEILKRSFFERDTLLVARRLLGSRLVRHHKGRRMSGMVIETEAYLGADDSASHAYRGKTPRNQIMFGPAGIAYVYFTYGMHYLLNAVTQAPDNPCAVLFRAIMPLQGQRHMEALRGKRGPELTNGPAKLCQAMAIDLSLNAWDLVRGKKLWLENHIRIPKNFIGVGPRIGIDYAASKDRQAPWRFWVRKQFTANLQKSASHKRT
jgi:DNA-3-methyladenine glycosylase